MRSMRIPRLPFTNTTSPARSRAWSRATASSGDSVCSTSAAPAFLAASAPWRERGPKKSNSGSFAAWG